VDHFTIRCLIVLVLKAVVEKAENRKKKKPSVRSLSSSRASLVDFFAPVHPLGQEGDDSVQEKA